MNQMQRAEQYAREKGIGIYQASIEIAEREIKDRITELAWDNIDVQSRKYILEKAGVNFNIANLTWHDIEPWLRNTIIDSLERCSEGKVTLSS